MRQEELECSPVFLSGARHALPGPIRSLTPSRLFARFWGPNPYGCQNAKAPDRHFHGLDVGDFTPLRAFLNTSALSWRLTNLHIVSEVLAANQKVAWLVAQCPYVVKLVQWFRGVLSIRRSTSL